MTKEGESDEGGMTYFDVVFHVNSTLQNYISKLLQVETFVHLKDNLHLNNTIHILKLYPKLFHTILVLTEQVFIPIKFADFSCEIDTQNKLLFLSAYGRE